MGCRQIHLPHATFSHVQSLHKSHSTNDMCTMAHVSPCASQHTEHTSTSSLSPTSPVFLSSSSPNPDLSTHPLIHCEDPRWDGTSTEFHASTRRTRQVSKRWPARWCKAAPRRPVRSLWLRGSDEHARLWERLHRSILKHKS